MKLLDQMRRACRTKHLSLSTEQAYVRWTRRYVRYHGTLLNATKPTYGLS